MNQNEKSGFTFEPYSLISDIVRNIWLCILAALIGYMGVGIYTRSVYRPEYTSSATLIVNLKNSSAYSYANVSVASEMAEIFSSVFVQPSMSKRAAENLGLDSFSGKLTASPISDTNIFTVSVTASSPELAYRELGSVLEIYPEIADAVLSDAVIDVMRSPDLPSGASNSISGGNRTKIAGLCAFLVLAAIVLLSLLRDTVKDEKSFGAKIDAKLIGAIAHERPHTGLRNFLFGKKKSALLVTDSYASFRFAEGYNRLSTKIEYMNRTNGAKVFLITSVAENEGKSTIAANIALSLSGRGHKVALLDMDFKKPALHKIFEVKKSKLPDLGTVLSGKSELSGYALRQYQGSGLYLAVNMSPHEDYVGWIHSERVSEVVDSLKNGIFDYVIIDTPPLFAAADVPVIARLADAVFVAVRTDCVQAADINDSILSLSNESGKFTGCVLNDVHPEISLLGQLGADESGNHGGKYGYYYKYKNYKYRYQNAVKKEDEDK